MRSYWIRLSPKSIKWGADKKRRGHPEIPTEKKRDCVFTLYLPFFKVWGSSFTPALQTTPCVNSADPSCEHTVCSLWPREHDFFSVTFPTPKGLQQFRAKK